MKTWLIAVFFLVSIFFDGIIFPALFGFRESFLTIIFIVAMLLYYEVNLQSLIAGVVVSGIAEFYWGLKFGTLILGLFVSAGALFLLNNFFNIRDRIFVIISGVIVFVVFWATSMLATKIL